MCPIVCTLYSSELIKSCCLQPFLLMKLESQRNWTLFKWLLKHNCCPWILIEISLNAQTREGEISNLLTPQRTSSGHNMSSSCQPVTFCVSLPDLWVCRAAPWVKRCWKRATVSMLSGHWWQRESHGGSAVCFYGERRSGRRDFRWACPRVLDSLHGFDAQPGKELPKDAW